ncbi:hypothetical protein [Streptomyces sp. NPDC002490]|uniref:hypothetical protein n=1 Tax=Streptomyces sp. NPDC002490 TaxID=3154416 RepID=UPI00332E6716
MCAVPLAFALDDPAAGTTATLPFPRTLRRLLRLALVLVPLAALWTGCGLLLGHALDPAAGPGLVAGLSPEAGALAAVTVLSAAFGLRLGGGERGSPPALPCAVLLAPALALSPVGAGAFAVPDGASWAASRWLWTLALVVTAGAAGALLGEQRPRRGVTHGKGPAGNPPVQEGARPPAKLMYVIPPGPDAHLPGKP